MEFDELKRLLGLVQPTGWKVFEVHMGDFALRLERPVDDDAPTAPPASATATSPAPAAVATSTALPPPPPAAAVSRETAEFAGARPLNSPLVGIFHCLPGGKAIDTGTHLTKGTPVCIIEAMKLMNEIAMPEDGTIKWVALSEGEPVEYGQLLFTYLPDKPTENIL